MNKPRHRFQGTIINFIKDYQKKSKEDMKTHISMPLKTMNIRKINVWVMPKKIKT